MALIASTPLLLGAASCEKRGSHSSRDDVSTSSPNPSPSPSPSTGGIAQTVQPSGAEQLLAGYAVDRPDEEYTLPMVLREVSGITALSETKLACVQDEEGTVFFYDLEKRAIENQIRFGGPGDYEGIAWAGSALYVLRSDGTLFEIADYATTPKVQTLSVGVPTKDNEGLCHDPRGNRLLIAPKSRFGKGSAAKEARPLFVVDLATRKVASSNALVLDTSNVIDDRQTAARAAKKGKGGKKKSKAERPVYRFMPSAVAIQPSTGHIFVVSAEDRNLAVFDREGHLLERRQMDMHLYPQPEGLTFLPSGDLIISNEGGGGRGKLLRMGPKR